MSNKLRAVFEKGERLRYVSHLDILRIFVRALRRADIPVKYSEGFNPHAVMTFALPLGVGVTSECEMVDIKMKEYIEPGEFINRINENMLEGGIKILSAEYTDKPVMEMKRAKYIIDIENDKNIDEADLEKTLNLKEILIEKKSKKSVNTVNIMEHIFKYEITDICENKCKLTLIISAGNTFNLKPLVVMKGIIDNCDSLNPLLVLPKRVEFYE